MFLILDLFFLLIKHAYTQDHNTSPVEDLEISNIKFNSFLDIFPTYFNLRFSSFNYKYDILFFQQDNFNNSSKIKNFYHNYKSFDVKVRKPNSINLTSQSFYKANCTLILKNKFYKFLNKKNFTKMEKMFINLVTVSMYIIKHRSNFDQLWILIDIENERELKYKAIRLEIKDDLSRKKRNDIKTASYTRVNGKTYLNVETCIIVDSKVYELFSYLLNATDSFDYVKMYLELHFARTTSFIKKIYETFANDWFEITIELNHLKILTEFQPIFEKLRDALKFFDAINEQIVKKNWLNPDECDHIFYVHDYEYGSYIGQSGVGKICSVDKISIIRIDKSYSSEIVMAHELGHNLGSNHDYGDCLINNLMSPIAGSQPSTYKASYCSIKYLRETLFTEQRVLKEEFSCLIKKNSNKTMNTSVQIMPGLIFSKSEQCRFYMNMSETFACLRPEMPVCELYCYNPETHECDKKIEWLFDGTPCQHDMLCFNNECVHMNNSLSHIKVGSNLRPSVSIESKKNSYIQFIENSINQLVSMCSEGLSTETLAFERKKFLKHYKIDYTCDQMMYMNPESIYYKTRYILNAICCEKYVKWSYLNCTNKGVCHYPTCNQLKSNPCLNNGKCVDVKSKFNSSKFEFDCKCLFGFKGFYFL